MGPRQKAIALGKETVKKMKTKGWKVHIWKNPHWYVYIHKGMMTIRPEREYPDGSGKVSYTVTLSEDHLGASSVEYSTNRRFSDPNKAMEYALSLARKKIKKIQSVVARIEA